jgi:hypothetical protein
MEFELDEGSDPSIPLVATEPVAEPAVVAPVNPFGELGAELGDDYGLTTAPVEGPLPADVPMASVEIPIPPGILDSLPILGSDRPPATTIASRPLTEGRTGEGLVKEINIPLNLTLDEIRQHRRLRLKITLDVNLLP